jgi:hypothetical protein
MHDTSPCKVLYVYTRTSAAKYQSPASLQARRQLQPNLPLPCFSRTQHAEAAAAAFPQTASPSRACYHTDAVTRTHSPAIAGGRSRSHRSLPSHDRQHHRVRPSSTCPVACAPSDQRWSLLLFRRWQAASKRSQTNRPRMPWCGHSRGPHPHVTLAAPGPMRPRLLLFLFRPRSLCSPSDQEAAPDEPG